MADAEESLTVRNRRLPTKEEKEAIFKAARHGDLTTFQKLYSNGVDVISAVDVGEWTALHSAAEKGHYNVASALLQWEANVDAAEEFNRRTPLHYAARYGHTDIFKLLEANGGDVNKKDKSGETPLIKAANYKRNKEQQEAGVALAQIDEEEQPPHKKPRLDKEDKMEIETAARNGDVAALQKLYFSGVDVTDVVSDQNGFTGLHWAALLGHYDVATALLNWGTKVNTAGGMSKVTPLHMAARSRYTDIVALLIDNGADVNLKDESNCTPLATAVENNQSDTVYYLINEAKVDPSQLYEQSQQKIEQLMKEGKSNKNAKFSQTIDPQLGIPKGQDTITKRTVFAYKEAMKKGTRQSNQVKLVMIGAEGAGKTSTVRSFLGKEFQEDEPTTNGAELNSCTVERIFASKWQQCDIKDHLKSLPSRFRSGMKSYITSFSKKSDQQFTKANTQEEIPKEVAARVQEVMDTKEVSDGDVRVIILDLGGQEIYYEIHFMFLAPEDVVLMTFDASKDLDDPVISRQRYNRFKEKVDARGMQTNLEVLEMHLQSVYSHSGVEVKGGLYISKRVPTIIVIATHSKCLTEQQKEDIVKIFYKAFYGKPFMDHLPRSRTDAFHFIDNEERNSDIFAKVKHTIMKAGKPVIEKHCPITYLQFETGLLQASSTKSIITQQEALDIAREANIEENMLHEALLHFSHKGILLYYPDMPALKDVVFVNPQKVSDFVSSVISTHESDPYSASLQESCDRYDTWGLLEEDLLDDMITECGYLKQKELILDLLKKFDLVAEVPVDTKFDREDDSYEVPKEGKVFLVPSMLVYNEKKIYKKKADDVVVLYHFPNKYVPESIFNHLLVKMVDWCTKVGHHVSRIHRGTGYFYSKERKQCFTLQLCQASYSIKCYFTLNKYEAKDKQMMLMQRCELLTYLKELVLAIHHKYIPSTRQPIEYLECPLDHPENCLPHIRLESINASNDVICSKGDQCRTVPKRAYMLLLTTESNEGLGSSSGLEKAPTLKQLTNIVLPNIAAEWRTAAINLDFELSTIKIIQEKGGNDPERCCLEMLGKWHERSGHKTWKTLLSALKDSVKFTNICDEIEKKLETLL